MITTETMIFRNRTLIAEASSLGFTQYTPGAEIRIKSHITGQELIFSYLEAQKNDEGEIISWTYEPNGMTGEDYFTLIIFND